MKCIYFTNYDLQDSSSGVCKKILMQADAFDRAGVEVVFPKVRNSSKINRILMRIPLFESMYDINIERYLANNDISIYDFVYFRHDCFSKKLLDNFCAIKALSNAKIIYEIPTYPYDKNEFHIRNFWLKKKDTIYRKRASAYIDRIVDFSGSSCIYNIPCINISNSIDINKYAEKKPTDNNNELHLIGVALLAKVHGFDRIIKSLRTYYLNKEKSYPDIYFHIVGDGDAKNELVKLAIQLGLKEYVIFHGLLYSDELNKVYDISNIGVGCLGIHRRYVNQKVSSLKTKEYAAKGLPFISGENDVAFEHAKFPWKYDVESDESEIDLHSVVGWYRNLISASGSEMNMCNSIREYASRYLGWDEQMKIILDYVKTGK